MSLFYIRNDRASIPPRQKEDTRAEIEARLRTLDPADPGYTAVVAQVVDEVVTSRSNLFRWSTDDARILRSELANLAVNNLSVYLTRRDELKARQAQTSLDDAKGILREEDLVFRGFTRVRPADAVVEPQELMGVIKGLGGLAASLGAPRAADGWFAREVTETVEGPRSNQLGQYGKRAREFMMPMAELKGLVPTDIENKLLQGVLQTNRTGVQDALHAVLDALPGGKKADPTKADKTFLIPSSVLNRTNLLGTQLAGVRQYVDRGQAIPEGEYPDVRAAMQENHRLFVANNYAHVGPELRRGFDDLDPKVQRRNVPNMLGALHGLLQANRLVGEVLDHGILLMDGSPTEAGQDLQLHLVSSASHAMTLDFEGANAVFGGAVADEIGLLLAHRNGAQDQLGAIHDVVESAVLAAGNEFQLGGKKAGAAPGIALAHIGMLMKALDPTAKTTERQWAKKAESILARAGAADIAAICKDTFKIDELPEDLVGALKKEIDPNDYFYARIDELAGDPKAAPLTEEERTLLKNMLYLANATWKVGQVHRAISEGDLTRVNPSERERVFNPYDMCVTAAGSDLKSFFVVAKDLLVLRG